MCSCSGVFNFHQNLPLPLKFQIWCPKAGSTQYGCFASSKNKISSTKLKSFFHAKMGLLQFSNSVLLNSQLSFSTKTAFIV
jgi:hypothetical protein